MDRFYTDGMENDNKIIRDGFAIREICFYQQLA